MVKKPKIWNIPDRYPGKALDEIEPLPTRAWSALIRSKEKQVVQDGCMNLVGAVDIMHGLQYHHDRFTEIVKLISELPLLDAIAENNKRYLVHEAVAYLNRLGQYMYFGESTFVTDRINDSEKVISTIKKYIRYRHKHSAHRSIDKPRKDDSPHLQEVHAWSLSSIGPMHFAAKAGKQVSLIQDFVKDPKKMWTEYYACFHLMGDDNNDTLNFSIEREHSIFIKEAYELVLKLLSLP